MQNDMLGRGPGGEEKACPVLLPLQPGPRHARLAAEVALPESRPFFAGRREGSVLNMVRDWSPSAKFRTTKDAQRFLRFQADRKGMVTRRKIDGPFACQRDNARVQVGGGGGGGGGPSHSQVSGQADLSEIKGGDGDGDGDGVALPRTGSC